jgi:hypothetical protein
VAHIVQPVAAASSLPTGSGSMVVNQQAVLRQSICVWLLQAVMELLSDAVPNVRLVALGLLPALKQTIRLPEDVQQLVRARNHQ